ncbi:NfeD family protein, partial [Burkholderia sp. Ac-20353]|uniref:NfeD family protein n=1 Tax=Burkholderia sp. Ac-20353 TaxID=2703894 RepID=UPI002402DB13
PAPSAAGWARVHGERWRVACNAPLAAGSRVRVTGRQGLMLTVAPLYDMPPPALQRTGADADAPTPVDREAWDRGKR